MNNCPPDVSKSKPQEVSGSFGGRGDYRECSSEGFVSRTVSLYGSHNIRTAIESLTAIEVKYRRGETVSDELSRATMLIRLAQSEIEIVDVDGECPFAGDVDLHHYQNVEVWTCPVCREVHEIELDY